MGQVGEREREGEKQRDKKEKIEKGDLRENEWDKREETSLSEGKKNRQQRGYGVKPVFSWSKNREDGKWKRENRKDFRWKVCLVGVILEEKNGGGHLFSPMAHHFSASLN